MVAIVSLFGSFISIELRQAFGWRRPPASPVRSAAPRRRQLPPASPPRDPPPYRTSHSTCPTACRPRHPTQPRRLEAGPRRRPRSSCSYSAAHSMSTTTARSRCTASTSQPSWRPARLAGQEALIIAAIVRRSSASWQARTSSSRSTGPPPGPTTPRSTSAAPTPPFAGLRAALRPLREGRLGNADRNDIAFVFSASIPTLRARPSQRYAERDRRVRRARGRAPARLRAHAHATATTPGDVLGEVAFKPYTHVEIAKDVRDDLIEDGDLDIVGSGRRRDAFTHAVHGAPASSRRSSASRPLLRRHGRPRRLPRRQFGQRIIHPNDTGTWLARVFDMAWAAQTRHDASPPTSSCRSSPSPTASRPTRRATSSRTRWSTSSPRASSRRSSTSSLGETRGARRRQRDPPPRSRPTSATRRRASTPTPTAACCPTATSATTRRRASPSTRRSASSTRRWSSRSPATRRRPRTPAPADDHVDRGREHASPATDGGVFLDDDFQRRHADLRLRLRRTPPTTASSRSPTRLGDGRHADDHLESRELARRPSRPPATRRSSPAATAARSSTCSSSSSARSTTPLLSHSAARPARRSTSCSPRSSRCSPTATPHQPGRADDRRPGPGLSGELDADIDAGRAEWGRFGLATTNALFDAGTTRYWQNELAGNDGIDPNRGEDEADVGLLDVVLAELDDPNRDGNLDDSFLTNRLLPMLGLPRFVGEPAHRRSASSARSSTTWCSRRSASSSPDHRAARRRQAGRQGLRRLGDRALRPGSTSS